MTRRFVGAFLIAVMALGSVLLWLAIPVGWLYRASRVADSAQPSMGPYVMVLVGIPATMIAMGKLQRRARRRVLRRRVLPVRRLEPPTT